MKRIQYSAWGTVAAAALFLCGEVNGNATNVLSTCDEPSLRAAIATGGWISVTCNGTVTLTNTVNITNDVILDASGVSFGISGGNAVRIFCVTNGASLVASNLTLANGACLVLSNSLAPTEVDGFSGEAIFSTNADGGAIYNCGNVTLVGCTLNSNSAQALVFDGSARGGAIFNRGGTVTLSACAISNSLALGGGPNSRPPPPFTNNLSNMSLGGAVYNDGGTLVIENCNLSSNRCRNVMEWAGSLVEPTWSGLVMGGAVFQSAGTLTITGSCFHQNQAVGAAGPPPPSTSVGDGTPAYGGAVAVTNGSLSIAHSRFGVNQAAGGAAGDGTLEFAGYGGTASGGAVYCASAWTCADSSFTGNQAIAGAGDKKAASGSGGAICVAGSLELDRCSISSNSVQGGAGVAYNGGIPSVGGDGRGGAVFNGGQLAITNCTIALNTSTAGIGSLYSPSADTPYPGNNGNAMGGGVFCTNGIVLMMNDTVASNFCAANLSSPIGPGIWGTNGFAAGAQVANTNGTLHLHNTILAYPGTNINAYGTIADDGFNISSDGSANFSNTGSLNSTDPLLDPLANYGGPTWCMALPSGSPAVGTGDSSGAPATDQRGAPRPAGAGVDMGAYQLEVPPLSITCLTHANVLGFFADPSLQYHLLVSSNLISWTDSGILGPYSGPTNVSMSITPNARACYYRLMLP